MPSTSIEEGGETPINRLNNNNNNFKEILKVLKPSFEKFKYEGNKAMDIMAAERTYLTWIRTALSALTVGVAAVRLLDKNLEINLILSKIVGTFFCVIGLALTLYAFVRYEWLVRALMKGYMVTDLFTPHFIAVVSCFAMAAIVILFFV